MSLLFLRRSASGGGGVAAPTYAPWYKNALSSGSDGVSASAYFNNLSGRDTKTSTDITGPFGESVTVKVTAAAGASGNYGGSFLNSGVALSAGDQTWLRMYLYFPGSFCAGSGGGGDFDGSLKFKRFQFVNGDRLTGKIGGITNNACASSGSSPTLLGAASEIGSPGNNYLASPTAIARDLWVPAQWHYTHGATAGASALEMWLGSTYMGAVASMNGAQYPATASDVEYIVLGDYWNGDVKQATAFHLSNVIFTKQQPNTLDGGGRPFIDPATRITDFA